MNITAYSDDEMVMLSALQHYLFCPRQCALIHVEGVWAENYLTSAGRRLHGRVDAGVKETRRDEHIATALRLSSRRFGIMGVADVVEFHRIEGDGFDEAGRKTAVPLPERIGLWRPFPVEYKRGRPKSHRADEVQLCAQAICLEEMLGVTIPKGALFYGETRRRSDTVFDGELRGLVVSAAEGVRGLIRGGITPPPLVHPGCDACSIKEICRPDEAGKGGRVKRWVLGQIEGAGAL